MMKKLSLFDTVKGNLDFEAARFKAPDHCFFPVYFWLWNTLIRREEIKKQIDEMAAADIRAFMIVAEHPAFDPLIYTELSPPYLSDEFMELVQYAVDYGASKGMMIWLYDEAGWPSGSAGGQITKEKPELGWKVIALREVTLKKGSLYRQPEDCIAAYLSGKRLTDAYAAAEDVTVQEYYLNIISDFFMDVAEPEAVARFIELTHEKYKQYLGAHLGSTVQFMFTDEPKNIYPAFTYDFAARFSEKFGYDILDHLPVILKAEGADAEEIAIRRDYFTLCGELFRDRLLKKQYEWCEQNHILFGGHMAGEHDPRYCQALGRCNDIEALRQLALPGVDAIWRQIGWGKPIDKVEIAPEASEEMCIPFFPRFASSAARMNGVNQAMSESFAVYGSGLTFDEMRYVLNFQTVRGINLYSFMNISYGRDRFYAYSQRPSFGMEKPGYLNMAAINQYTARLCYVHSLGKSCVDTALYLPEQDLFAGGKAAQQACKAFYELGIALEMQGIEFDIIEDYGLAEAEFSKEGLKIGHALYKHVYIPENLYMPQKDREKLLPYTAPAMPVCESSAGFKQLRAAKRKTAEGNIIYFMYNESDRVLNTTITLPLGSRKLYELDLTGGNILTPRHRMSHGSALIELTLCPGESKTYLLTPTDHPAKKAAEPEQYKHCIELNEFSSAIISEFVLDACGGWQKQHEPIWQACRLGAWEGLYGQAFSGDIMYRTEIELDELPNIPPQLALGRVEHSARVFVNGVMAGIAAMSPKTVELDAKLFREGTNQIDILVSNTAANQFVLSEADQLYRPGELDRFHPMALVFEEQMLDGGLYGPVTLRY